MVSPGFKASLQAPLFLETALFFLTINKKNHWSYLSNALKYAGSCINQEKKCNHCISFPGLVNNKVHERGGLEQETVYAHDSGGWTFEVELSVELVPSEGSERASLSHVSFLASEDGKCPVAGSRISPIATFISTRQSLCI